MNEILPSPVTDSRGIPRWRSGKHSNDGANGANPLLARPYFSLRLQIILGFLLVFLLAVAIAVALMVSIDDVARSVRFLEIVSEYVFHIDSARQYEKNHFLYGTNLDDALTSVHRAEEILARNEEAVRQVLNRAEWQNVLENIDNYEHSLTELAAYEGEAGMAPGGITMEQYERLVRNQGHQMTQFARDIMQREQQSIEATMKGAERFQHYSIIFLLISGLVVAYFIGGNIVRSIVRYESYAERIAAGDFTPILPVRIFRDEFTDLALAINHMMVELRKHEDMLVQTHKMRAIGTLTAGVAHELNNPLNNMTLTAYMLLEDYPDLNDEGRKAMVQEIVQEADRAQKIVRNLLEFTRQSEIDFQQIDLGELVRETVALASNQLKIAKIKIDLELDNDLPKMCGDSQHLKQVVLNLILNAIHASKEKETIEIRVGMGDDPEFLSVKVIDSGTGIPEEVLQRVFDPFFTTKEPSAGTGLGLSVSKGIVEKHGGSILVESREGKGTCVTVFLPLKQPARTEAEPEEGNEQEL